MCGQKRDERIDPVIAQALRYPEPFRWGHGIGPATNSLAEFEFFQEAGSRTEVATSDIAPGARPPMSAWRPRLAIQKMISVLLPVCFGG
jgi:hypothetical protein